MASEKVRGIVKKIQEIQEVIELTKLACSSSELYSRVEFCSKTLSPSARSSMFPIGYSAAFQPVALDFLCFRFPIHQRGKRFREPDRLSTKRNWVNRCVCPGPHTQRVLFGIGLCSFYCFFLTPITLFFQKFRLFQEFILRSIRGLVVVVKTSCVFTY